mgnify:CR=1 FL=1
MADHLRADAITRKAGHHESASILGSVGVQRLVEKRSYAGGVCVSWRENARLVRRKKAT